MPPPKQERENAYLAAKSSYVPKLKSSEDTQDPIASAEYEAIVANGLDNARTNTVYLLLPHGFAIREQA